IKAAKATNVITFAAMINTKRPAHKIESPKNEKNGSFLPSASTSPDSLAAEPFIVAIVSSASETSNGLSIAVTITALIQLIGTAVKMNCAGIICMYEPKIEAVTQLIDIIASVKFRDAFICFN